MDYFGMQGLSKPDAYTPYAAGAKMYGLQAGSRPTAGPVDRTGYAERDKTMAARRNALLARLKMAQAGNYMSPEYLRGMQNAGNA